MKIFKYIIWVILIVVGIFYILPAALLQTPYFQKKISRSVAEYLEERIDTEVEIQQIEFQPFNKLILKNVYMEDQKGDTLFAAKRIACGFDFLPLFHQKFHFSSVQLYTFQFHLSKETETSPLNIQYIIDAFQNKNKKKTDSFIDLSINTLSLGLGSFSFRIKDKISQETKFNANDIYLTDISAKIHLNQFDNNNLNADIKRLSFKDKSGLNIKQFVCSLSLDKKGGYIDELFIELPQSKIHLADIQANFEELESHENRLEKAKINLQLKHTRIVLQDISPLAPVFSYFRTPLEIKGLASGTFDNLSFSDLIIKESKDLFLWLNADIKNLNSSNPSDIFIQANIKDSYINSNGILKLVENFNKLEPNIPTYIYSLGHVALEGNISGYLNNLISKIHVNSDIGTVDANINLGKQESSFLKGSISSPSLDIKSLLNDPDFGIVIFNIEMDIINNQGKGISGKINALINEAEYKGYKYENINLLGELTPNSFNGILNAESPDGKLAAEGLVVIDGKNSEFNFNAKASRLLLDKLNLTQKYTNPELSFNINANFKGDDIENVEGTMEIKNILFSTDKGGYTIDHINIVSNKEEGLKEWVIESSILNGNIKGDYSLNKLINSLKNSLSYHLPSLISSKPIANDNNNISFNLSINDTRELSYIFELPFTFYNQASIKGYYDSQIEDLQLSASFPYFKYNNNKIENVEIKLTNKKDFLDLKITGASVQKNDNRLNLYTEFKAMDDSIFSNIKWMDNKNGKYKGNFDFDAHIALAKDNKPLFASIHINPSELIFNDSLWVMSPTSLKYDNNRIHIDKLEASHNDQYIKIDGYVSKDPADEILLNLNKVDLDYIFNSLNKKALTFGGIASGYVIAKDLYNTRQLSTQLDVRKFSFNYIELGDLALNGRWIEEEGGVEMKGKVVKNDSSFVDVDGFIYPAKEELSILFDAQNTNAAFLRKYVDNIVQDLSGELTGKLRLFGELNDPTVEGDVFVKDGKFGIEFLNTQYSFTDWVHCDPDRINISNALFYDKYGNKALVNGYVTHNLFSDFHFSANLNFENFMIFDATSQTNPTFYGPVFGTGTASIKGTEEAVDIDVSMNNTANTHLTLNFMDEADVEEYNFIHFIQKEKQDTIREENPWILENKISRNFNNDNSGTDIRLNLLVNANNQATVEMIMDPTSGDKISGRGNGSLQIQYGTKIPMKVIGTYQIERGRYNFSFQQALFRNFEIEEGSSVTFRGDPYSADLNIKAAYTVTANLGDLDQQLLQMSPRNNVPVNCVLLLSGSLQQPLIKFDIELPNSSTELERQVKSYIRTEDLLNRQIVYLLVLSRFYTSPEYTRGDNGFNNDLSYLTSTLSTQISNILGGISDNFKVGTKFHQAYEGEETSTEVELLLSSTLLNNRLTINGNFGYIDNPYTNQGNNNIPLVGDFDIEYKLTKSGDIRLRGFNRYNYRNYFSTTPEMTQGVGILFRRDFNNLRDLFSRRKNIQLIYIPEENKNEGINSSSVENTEKSTEEEVK